MPLEFFGERWLLLGRPKTGKSEAAASFPNVYVINGDGPINRYAYRNAEVRDDTGTWADFQQALTRAEKNPHWTTLILDTVDKLVVAMNRAICESKKMPSIGDIPHGAGWERQVARFTQYMERFWSIAEARPGLVATIVVAHSKIGDDNQKSLVIRKSLMTYLQGSVCNIGYAYKKRMKDEEGNKKLRYFIDLSGDQATEAGCRNFTLNEAGEIDHTGRRGSCAFDALCDLFAPDEKKMKQALKWLQQKGGIEEEDIREYCADREMRSDAELYEFIKRLRRSKTQLSKVKKSIESEE
jgi:hypothetical protein